MSPIALNPLRFETIYQYRLWGGRRLAGLLAAPLPGDDPIGEAWILSDRDDHQSRVADGPLKGQTISQLLAQFPEQVMDQLADLGQDGATCCRKSATTSGTAASRS
jgi:mannose-6-phosphate isomerase